MQYSELRIGNWLKLNSERSYCVIRRISETIFAERLHSKFENYPIEFYQPILFNEDVLSAALFHPSRNGHTKKTEKGDDIHCTRISQTEYVLNYKEYTSAPFSYVHEFQNAYSDITGEEMSPNLFGLNL